MASVIRDLLPLGLGIALNPIAITAGILLLAAANSRANGIAFTVGWVLGLTTLLVLVTLLVQGSIARDRETTSLAVALANVALGLLLFGIAAREWLAWRRPGPPRPPPFWMRFLVGADITRALLLGAFLAIVSLKNLVIIAAAAAAIGQAGLVWSEVAIVVTVFVAISTLGILIPLLVRLRGRAEADAMLATWRDWLDINIGVVTAGVLVVMGSLLFVRGLAALG